MLQDSRVVSGAGPDRGGRGEGVGGGSSQAWVVLSIRQSGLQHSFVKTRLWKMFFFPFLTVCIEKLPYSKQ